MKEQGRSTLAAGQDGQILDRLTGLEKVIPSELIRQALQATNRINGRSCKLTHEIMLWIVLAMGLLTDLPIRQVFKHARRLRPGDKTPGRSSLCEARQRLGVEPVQELHRLVVRPLATVETPGAFYQGYRLMGIDGVVMDVPDSAANAEFGRSTGGRGDGAFPQVRKVSLVELGTHVETAIAIGGWHDGERLSDGSYLAKIYPNSYDRKKDRNGIVVRVIEYTLNDPQRKGHGETHRLITNLLDEALHPALELIQLYHERWEEELVFDEQKTHQDPRRAEKPAQMRSETPSGVLQEVYALSLAHFVIRSLMFTAAQTAHLDPDRLSFTGCFHILQCRLPECSSRTPVSLTQWFDALLAEMREEVIEPRRNRVNPRVIKRKMSKWRKKRAAHRPVKPLLKTFDESVVMSQ